MAAFLEKYTFKVEWLDAVASLKRYYLLQYYVTAGVNELELFDIKNKRVFLRRCPFPSLKLSDLFLGAKLTVYARQMTVVDYGDSHTRRLLGNTNEIAFGLVTPAALRGVSKILTAINDAELQVAQLRLVQLNREDASTLGSADLASGRCVPLQVVGLNAVETWSKIAASTGCFAPPRDQVELYNSYFFGNKRLASAGSTARCANCTLSIIKPHAVKEGKTGAILGDLLNTDLEVTAFEMFDIDLVAAEEFFEVYKGVLPEYSGMTDQLASGRLVAVELVGDDAVHRLRQITGPRHVDVAQRIAPDTLRAKHGVDTIRNAVHATDLDEDGVLESEYFFRILQQ